MRDEMPSTPMRHATPSRGMDTPSRDPFNPAIPNTPRPHDTPRHHGGWDDEPGSGWGNPPTPRSAITPVPSTPGTPGAYSYNSSYFPTTPLSHTPQTPSAYTPGYDRSTPQDGTPQTPFSSTPTPSTPHTPGSGLGIPQTPTPHTPSTPGSALGLHEYGDSYPTYEEHPTPQTQHAEETHEAPTQWHHPKLYAAVSASYKSGMYQGAVGIIQEVLGDQSRITLPDRGDESLTLPNDVLEPVAPGKRDRLRVVGGGFSGESGVLIGVYGNDGIVKMDVNLEIKILPMTSLAKLAA
jgi:transcription elongation factor SPT5